MEETAPAGEIPWTEEELILKSTYKIETVKLSVRQLTASAPPPPEPVAQEHTGPKRPKIIRILTAGVPAATIQTQAPSSGGIVPQGGETIFLEHDLKNNVHSTDWDSRATEEPLKVKLDDLRLFDSASPELEEGNNTVVVWATMPTDSERFSFILARNSSHLLDDPQTTFYYRFDALDDATSQRKIVQSARGNDAPISQADESIKVFPFERNRQFQLRLVLCTQGVAVFLEGRFVSEFAYRPSLTPTGTSLHFICLTKDEQSGARESIVVNRVWWGRTAPQVPIPGTTKRRLAFEAAAPDVARPLSALSGGGGSRTDDGPADRTLFIAGLPKDATTEQELRRLFEHYQVDSTSDGRICIAADPVRGQGFVKLQNVRNMEMAINYLNNITIPSGSTLVVQQARRKQVPNWFYC